MRNYISGIGVLLLPIILVSCGPSAEQVERDRIKAEQDADALRRRETTNHLVQILNEYRAIPDGLTAARRAARIRAIDVSAAPNDFRAAFERHAASYDRWQEAKDQIDRLVEQRESGQVLVSVLVQGSLRPGMEFNDALAAARENQRLAQQSADATWSEVRAIASQNGVVWTTEPESNSGDALNNVNSNTVGM